MATATELTIAEQFEFLREIAINRGWSLQEPDGSIFIIGLPSSDKSWFWLLVDCANFTQQPPAFHWYNPETKALDQPVDAPKGGTYFHSSGRICAPWNRLAYQQCDPKGPHGDWQLAGWLTNDKTGGTTTLAAMILRINYELFSQNYKGRLG